MIINKYNRLPSNLRWHYLVPFFFSSFFANHYLSCWMLVKLENFEYKKRYGLCEVLKGKKHHSFSSSPQSMFVSLWLSFPFHPSHYSLLSLLSLIPYLFVSLPATVKLRYLVSSLFTITGYFAFSSPHPPLLSPPIPSFSLYTSHTLARSHILFLFKLVPPPKRWKPQQSKESKPHFQKPFLWGYLLVNHHHPTLIPSHLFSCKMEVSSSSSLLCIVTWILAT